MAKSGDKVWLLHVWEGRSSVPVYNEHGNAAFCCADTPEQAEDIFRERFSEDIGLREVRLIVMPGREDID